MSEEEEIIIIGGGKRPQSAYLMTLTQESIYDAARAIIDTAELSGTPIVFQFSDETPVD